MLSQSWWGFFTFYVLSVLLVLGGNDWFLVWIGLELNMLSFLVLIFSKDGMSIESCLKYFFVQSIGSGLFLMSLYVSQGYSEDNIFGFLIISYKLGAGPFYFWFPSVCDGVSWGSCFMLMSAQKIMPMYLMSYMMSEVVWIIIFLSLIIGVLGCFDQTKMKRLMSFSSIHHIGWMMACVCFSMSLWFLYLMVYTLMMMGLMMLVWKYSILMFSDISSKGLTFAFIFMMMNMSGIPPMSGFFLKWEVFTYMMMLDSLMAVFMILFSVCMLYVYMRVCYLLFIGVNYSHNYVKLQNNMKSGLDMLWVLGSMFGGSMLVLLL